MDDLEKFLRKLSKKERMILAEEVFPRILRLQLSGLDVKKMKGMAVWRLRHGKMRVLFVKDKGRGIIIRIGYRKDVYHN